MAGMNKLTRRAFLASLAAVPLAAKVAVAAPTQVVKAAAPLSQLAFNGPMAYNELAYLFSAAIGLGKLPTELDHGTVHAWAAFEGSK
jgi:hypothetical protein